MVWSVLSEAGTNRGVMLNDWRQQLPASKKVKAEICGLFDEENEIKRGVIVGLP